MKHEFSTLNCSHAALGILLIGTLFQAGCGRPAGQIFPPVRPPRVWPEPPEQPRIRYVGMISTEKDLKPAISWTEGLGELFFGKKAIGVLLNPYTVAFDARQRLFVADTAAAVVHVFDLSTRNYYQFGSTDDEQLVMPVALALVGERIYVVDSVLHNVCVFDKQGKFEFSFAADVLKRPAGIACWQEAGRIFVSDAAGHVVLEFDTDGRLLNEIGRRGSAPGQFNFPTHLCVDIAGRLYVSDTLNYRIQVFSPEGKFLEMFGEHGDRPGYFAHPCGIATDRFGNIYVGDRQFENIQVFNGSGEILMAWGREGDDIGQFWLPGGIYIDDRSNRIYVADSFNKRVQVFELLEGSGS